MFKKILFIGLFLVSTLTASANAAYFQIENHLGVKSERWHQFRAVLYLNNGARIDVTRNAMWTSFGNDMRLPGEFYFKFDERSDRQIEKKYISATVFYNGYQFSAAGYVKVDQSPDYMEIIGPRNSRSRGTIQFQAIGIYPGKRIDLTEKGEWSAEYGDVNDQGRYLAPSVSRGGSLEDIVGFQFGFGRGQAQVSIEGGEE
jgi:hypothetical protein